MEKVEYERLVALEERVTFIMQRLEIVEKNTIALNELASTMKVLANDQKHVLIQVNALNEKVDCIEKLPGKRWNSMVDKIIAALVGGIIGFFLTSMI